MTVQHEEMEVAHELDRALRAAVTGLAQLMERRARTSQDKTRDAAARAREEWLGRRDAARTQFMPWTAPDRLEKLSPVAASRRWAVAAAWSDLDPIARTAEQDMAGRIRDQHGRHPSEILRESGTTTEPAEAGAPAAPLGVNAAHQLAVQHAPSWYRIPADIEPLETDRQPSTDLETRFVDDWQHYVENGRLPDRSAKEAWAGYSGRGDEFAYDKWTDREGVVDQVGRDALLAAVWEEGRDSRSALDLADHDEALHTAGLPPVSGQITGDLDVPQDHAWHALLTPSRFDAASSEDLATAWRDASAVGLTGDLGAQRSADRIATMMRERRGVSPDQLLIQTLTEQAAAATEARRAAEDRARRQTEADAATAAGRRDPSATPITDPLSSPAASSGHTADRTPSADRSTQAADQTQSTSRTAPAPAGRRRTAGDSSITRDRTIELNELAADYYASNLRPGTAGHNYLRDRLGDEFDTGPWRLGYARPGWQNLTNHLRGRGVADGEMVAAGLAEAGKFGVRDVFRDRVMMGVRDHKTGELVGFLGRDLSGDPRAPKVRNTGETPAFRKGDHVFGLHEAEPGARIAVVEGPFDAMAVGTASGHKVTGVSTMGTAMTNIQAEAIARQANGRVWTAYDNDAAGRSATEAAFWKLSDLGADVRQLDVPGSDPAEAWQTRPPLFQSALLVEMPDAHTAAETVIDNYLAGENPTREGFTALMDNLRPRIPDHIDAELLDRRISELDRQAPAQTGSSEGREASTMAGDRRLPTGERPEPVTEKTTPAPISETVTAEQRPVYDRRTEASTDHMSDGATSARDASSHGFSRSTHDQLVASDTQHGGRARVQRGPGQSDVQNRIRRR